MCVCVYACVRECAHHFFPDSIGQSFAVYASNTGLSIGSRASITSALSINTKCRMFSGGSSGEVFLTWSGMVRAVCLLAYNQPEPACHLQEIPRDPKRARSPHSASCQACEVLTLARRRAQGWQGVVGLSLLDLFSEGFGFSRVFWCQLCWLSSSCLHAKCVSFAVPLPLLQWPGDM